mmetsp:Transcript_25725/g.56406  ORF Transcript_25725/g.56406 Transcript_25725/m.56406 type:complete len:216 (+) Transcript_25725:259-906(+)
MCSLPTEHRRSGVTIVRGFSPRCSTAIRTMCGAHIAQQSTGSQCRAASLRTTRLRLPSRRPAGQSCRRWRRSGRSSCYVGCSRARSRRWSCSSCASSSSTYSRTAAPRQAPLRTRSTPSPPSGWSTTWASCQRSCARARCAWRRSAASSECELCRASTRSMASAQRSGSRRRRSARCASSRSRARRSRKPPCHSWRLLARGKRVHPSAARSHLAV